MSISFGDVPASVLRGRACAVCWGSIWTVGCYSQTLDGVTRFLCSRCATTFQPVKLPGHDEPSQVVHLDVDSMIREVEERQRRERVSEPPAQAALPPLKSDPELLR